MASTEGVSDPNGGFRVDLETRHDTVILGVTGELDMLTAPNLDRAAHQALDHDLPVYDTLDDALAAASS